MKHVALIASMLAIITPHADAKNGGWRHTSPWVCQDKPGSDYTTAENACVIRRVFHKGWRGALAIARCESGPQLDARMKMSGGDGASGLFQFLVSTWNSQLPHSISRHSVFHPVWNAKGAKWLHDHDGNWHQWSCSSITGVYS